MKKQINLQINESILGKMQMIKKKIIKDYGFLVSLIQAIKNILRNCEIKRLRHIDINNN